MGDGEYGRIGESLTEGALNQGVRPENDKNNKNFC